jgi:hypothetical protein
MIFSKRFQRDKYLQVSGFLAPDVARVASDYALLRRAFFPEVEAHHAQVPDTHSVYGDTLMETLLLHCLPKMEVLTGLTLYPTYSYYRVYKPGDDLKKHRDRRACEISVSICLGYNYATNDPDYRWKIYIAGKGIGLDRGDGIIYKGCEVEHWRDVFDAGADSWQAQLFLHYVDAAKKDSRESIYDKRTYAGALLESTKPEPKKSRRSRQHQSS